MESLTKHRRHILDFDSPECPNYIRPSIPRYYSNFYDWRKAFFPTQLYRKLIKCRKQKQEKISTFLKLVMLIVAIILIAPALKTAFKN